ncbi:carbohydrate ABC transporter permease [uncultured Helcococcus sp.]|uniref:carbohydrate ABC transporter permease n=1 Tax=uncultured Helcococcus sp. TaxID=1072508 RepID=UPI00288BFF4F|nr:carbohydrate ABC transporter permease [uncultured Helcococcus sp.]
MKKFNDLIVKIVIIALAIITLFPFVYMLLSSLMSYQEVNSIPPTLIPSKPLFHNYVEAFQKAPFARYFINTVFTATATTIMTLITTVLAAFAFVKLQFKGKNVVSLIFAALLMVPYEITVFTNYQTILKWGFVDTYFALILPHCASIFYIFYLRGYLQSIPMSYYNAAKVDGASDLEFIWKILVPISKPALFTMGILSFISGWNSFLWPILVTNEKNMRLISNGLAAFTSEAGSQTQLQMAASAIAIVPILILYFVFRSQIMRGVSRSGLKG